MEINKEKFINKIYKLYNTSDLSLLECLAELKVEYKLDVETIKEYVKSEKTFYADLESECQKNKLLKTDNKKFDINKLFK